MSPAKVTPPGKAVFFVPEKQYMSRQPGFDNLDEQMNGGSGFKVKKNPLAVILKDHTRIESVTNREIIITYFQHVKWFYVINCGNDLTYSHLERSERSRRFCAVCYASLDFSLTLEMTKKC